MFDGKILVTGPSGFIGGHISRHFSSKGYSVQCACRSAKRVLEFPNSIEIFEDCDVKSDDNWNDAFDGINTVVHCAGISNAQEKGLNELPNYIHEINAQGTRRIAEIASLKNVKRFIFISTAKVFGEISFSGKPFNLSSAIAPEDEYASSKWGAEKALLQIAQKTDLEVVIIRPAIVFGPKVSGNFLRLLKISSKPIPLPIKGVKNKRSFLGISNLLDLIEICVNQKSLGGEIFLAADEQSLSTSELVNAIKVGLKKYSLQFSFPSEFLRLMARLVNKEGEMNRIIGNLEVDSSSTYSLLGWKPKNSTADELEKTLNWYKENF